MKWMYDDQAPKKGEGQRYYTQNMLYDAGSLTSVTNFEEVEAPRRWVDLQPILQFGQGDL